jgi:hypothetical protein
MNITTINVSAFLNSKYAIIRADGERLFTHIESQLKEDVHVIVVIDFTDMAVVASPFLNGLASKMIERYVNDDLAFSPDLLRILPFGYDSLNFAKFVYGNYLYRVYPEYRVAIESAVAIEVMEDAPNFAETLR